MTADPVAVVDALADADYATLDAHAAACLALMLDRAETEDRSGWTTEHLKNAAGKLAHARVAHRDAAA